MTEIDFWNLIDLARRSVSSTDEIPKWLVNHLENLPESEIGDFGRIFRQMNRKAYDERLWAAAYAISHHSASDDVFSDFRGWLIAQGKDVYEKALNDPDSLADLARFDGEDGQNARLESMLSVAGEAYESKTGENALAIFSDWRRHRYSKTKVFGMAIRKHWQDSFRGCMQDFDQTVESSESIDALARNLVFYQSFSYDTIRGRA